MVDELPDLGFDGRLALYSNNEPLLDKKIVERVGYAKSNCANTTVYILTNVAKLTTELALDLPEAGIDFIKIDNYSNRLKLHRNIEKLVGDFEQPESAVVTDNLALCARLEPA